MKATSTLPENYNKYYSVDLQKNKKIAVIINLLAFVITIIMVVAGIFINPIMSFLDTTNGYLPLLARLVCIALGSIAYIILHELIHGIAMKICGTKKIKFGFTGLYAFAGSNDYYDKKAYVFIALAPVVFWGIILGVLNFLVSEPWFWVVYIIQIFNISGAVGDYFVTIKFINFPKDILIKDDGVSMTVYSTSPSSI